MNVIKRNTDIQYFFLTLFEFYRGVPYRGKKKIYVKKGNREKDFTFTCALSRNKIQLKNR